MTCQQTSCFPEKKNRHGSFEKCRQSSYHLFVVLDNFVHSLETFVSSATRLKAKKRFVKCFKANHDLAISILLQEQFHLQHRLLDLSLQEAQVKKVENMQ